MASKSKVSRRQFLHMTGLTALSAALAACAPAPAPTVAPVGQDPAGATSVPQPADQGTTTIRFRYPHPESHQLGAAQKRHLEKYNYQVPGADVKVELELGITMDRTSADLAAGTAPDVFWDGYDAQGIIQGVHEGLFVPAEELMDAAGFDMSDFVDGLRPVYTFEGKMWGIPYEQVVVLWATNPKVFADAGVEPPRKDWTWDDVIQVGLQVTRDKTGRHPNDAGFDINEVDVWALQPWQAFVIQEYLPYTAGGSYVDETRTKATIDSDAFVDTLQWLRDIYQKHHIATMSPPEKGLFTGNIAIQETGNWALIDFAKNMEEVGCVYTPCHPGKQIKATPWFDKELWLPKQEDADRVDAAYTFASWWAFEEYLDFAIDTGYFPFLKSHMQDPKWQEVIKDKPYMQVAMEMPAFATPRFWSLFPGSIEAQKVLSEMWDAAVHTEDDIKQLVATANAEVQRIIDKNAS